MTTVLLDDDSRAGELFRLRMTQLDDLLVTRGCIRRVSAFVVQSMVLLLQVSEAIFDVMQSRINVGLRSD